ncbi:hypothetical protein TcWFU_009435 [Taenia crassiceps]|uniref:Uncharacterized protein n=1 Tax=Taenia crassiceps TaxID=6207 RepID=A0ABR4QM95_9CEST
MLRFTQTKTNFTTANNQLTDDQRNELISDLVRKCDEIQEKLDREIALRKEQMDIFTHDILKLKNEKEILSKENQKKDQVIEELRENSSTQKDRLLEMEEKFEACKQALTIEIKRRKGLERKIGEERGNFPTSKKEASQHMSTSCETASSSADNRRDLCNSICELSKLVTSQAEELKQLKKVIYKSEEQRPSNSSFIHMQPKLTDDQMWKEATGAKGDSQSGVSIGRRRWRDAEELKTFEESGVHEDPIQPTEKKKTLSLKL